MPETNDEKQIEEEARRAPELAKALDAAKRKLLTLENEHEDLNLLYEATIAHGEAVEDQLADANAELTLTQARLREELDEAATYARSVLPAPRLDPPGADWHYEPSTELGGDLLGYHHIDANHFAIYLLDVCGHGVGPALLSFSVNNVLRGQTLADTDFLSPSSVLAALNDAFAMENQHDKFFTMWYGVHDARSGELRYASGGHPPAILVRTSAGGDSTEMLGNIGNIAVGTVPNFRFGEGTTTVAAGDRLIVYSDGAFELPDAEDGMMGPDDLVDFLAADTSRGPTDFYSWVRSRNGDQDLPDDFSLLRISF